MAPWKSIEFGFQLGMHMMFGVMGTLAAIGLVFGAIWLMIYAANLLRQKGEKL